MTNPNTNKGSMKKVLLSVLFFGLLTNIIAQKEVNISQYMLSRYSINSAFGGSHEALTLLGSYRQKWSGVNEAPASQYFSAHAPLKNESVAFGLEFFSQNYAVTNESGVAGSYTYRVRPTRESWLAFSLSGGYSFAQSNWAKVSVKDPDDDVFAENEKYASPLVGFATAWYSNRFFAGVSVPNFYYTDLYETGESKFDPANAQYLITGGYLFRLSNSFKFQPSTLVILNKEEGTIYDLSGSVIWKDMIWVGFTYRSTDEMVGMMAYQIFPQLRFAYSYDYSTGELQQYNSGTHEISLQFDFGFKVNTPSPKFF